MARYYGLLDGTDYYDGDDYPDALDPDEESDSDWEGAGNIAEVELTDYDQGFYDGRIAMNPKIIEIERLFGSLLASLPPEFTSDARTAAQAYFDEQVPF